MKDADGREIKVGSRVYVRPRPSTMVRGQELPGFGGEVTSLEEPGTVHITEYGTCHCRSARAEHVAVQYGETQASLEHEAMMREIARRRGK